MQSAPFNFSRLLISIGRLVLGGIFIFAGYSKLFAPNLYTQSYLMFKLGLLMNLSNFENQVRSYNLLSDSGVWFVAHALPPAEIVLGLLVLAGWRVRYWLTLVTAILGGFFVVVTRAYLLHLEIDCGCFGKPEPLTGWTVLRDAALLALAVAATVFAYREARAEHPWAAASPERAS